MADLISEAIEQYCMTYTSPETPALAALNRETHSKVLMPQMLSGHLQGRFLTMISQMIHPRYILEIGTFTGYSAICLAKGLQENGKLITIDINEELKPMAMRYAELDGIQDKIEFLTGNALDIIPQRTEMFDLVFIDADKQNYAKYFDLVIGKVRTGGWILADNVLWSGKVLEQEKDKDTLALDGYNKKIASDPRVENMILPLRDGISIARKTG